jgi:hypothetical protein
MSEFKLIWKVPPQWAGASKKAGHDGEEVLEERLAGSNQMEAWVRHPDGSEDHIASLSIGEDGKCHVNIGELPSGPLPSIVMLCPRCGLLFGGAPMGGEEELEVRKYAALADIPITEQFIDTEKIAAIDARCKCNPAHPKVQRLMQMLRGDRTLQTEYNTGEGWIAGFPPQEVL